MLLSFHVKYQKKSVGGGSYVLELDFDSPNLLEFGATVEVLSVLTTTTIIDKW